MYIRAKASYV